jgi:hypothetical protein
MALLHTKTKFLSTFFFEARGYIGGRENGRRRGIGELLA